MRIKRIARNKILLGGILTVLVLSSFLINPATANGEDDEDDEDEDGVHDDEEEENRRGVTVEVSGTEAQIESHQNYSGIQNEISIQMKAESEGLEFEFSFDNESDVSEFEIEFSVEISEICASPSRLFRLPFSTTGKPDRLHTRQTSAACWSSNRCLRMTSRSSDVGYPNVPVPADRFSR